MSPTIVMIISDRVFPSKMTAFGMKHAKDAFEQAQPTGTWSNFATRSILLRYSTSSPLHHRIICTNPIHLFASMFLYFKHLLNFFPVHSRRRSANLCKLANSNSVCFVFADLPSSGRVGAPSDIGGVLLFLVSPAAAHVTSATIVVDGGQLVTYGAFAKL
jgi:hypothetical protein